MSVHANKSEVTGKITSYTVRYRDHNGVQQRARFKAAPGARAEAKAFDAEVSAAKAKGNTTDVYARRGQTFAEVAEQLRTTTAHDLSRSTRTSDEIHLRVHILPTFASRPINAITTMEVQAWYNELREKVSERTHERLSASTMHNVGVTLSKTFDFALRLGLMQMNPYAHIVKGRVRKNRRPFLTGVQVAALGRIMDATPPNGLILRFAAYTGLRSAELAALRVGDVTDMRGSVALWVTVTKQTQGGEEVRTKTEAGVRRVPLSGVLRAELENHLAAHPYRHDPTASLWPGRRPGTKGDELGLDYDRPLAIESLKRNSFKPALATLGLTGFAWHDLRHFYATTLIHTRRYSDKQVQEWMGHMSYSFTVDRYGHAPDVDVDMSAFDDYLSDQSVNVRHLRRG